MRQRKRSRAEWLEYAYANEVIIFEILEDWRLTEMGGETVSAAEKLNQNYRIADLQAEIANLKAVKRIEAYNIIRSDDGEMRIEFKDAYFNVVSSVDFEFVGTALALARDILKSLTDGEVFSI